MIIVKGVSKTFRSLKKAPGFKESLRALVAPTFVEKQALLDVSLSIEPGELVGLVGANGAGKTTLVKILSGIIPPSSGVVDVLGFVPFDRALKFRQQIALAMGQKAQLWWDLPAADCFLLLKEIYSINDMAYKANLNELIEILGVGELLHIPIRRLSLGERMKMELIATMLHSPKVVFLDEPTIGLDITSQRTIRRFLLDYKHRHNPAMILTSHYMEDIRALCQRIIVIKNGQIVYDGPTADVGTSYANKKILSIQLPTNFKNFEHAKALASGLGSILQAEADFLQILVPAERTADALRDLLSILPAVDVTVENEDFASMMESLI